MMRTHLVSFVVAMTLLGSPSLGEACSCGPNYPPSVVDQYDSADAAFTGIVASVDTVELFQLPFYDVEFLVTGVWKGVSSQVVHVLTTTTDGSCGIQFPLFLGEEFVVYAYADRIYPSGQLSTHSCTRTLPVAFAQEDFEVLGDPTPVPVRESSWGAIKALYD